MKILLSRSTDGTSTGGGEMSTRDHALVLRQLGHSVSIVSNLDYMRDEAEKHDLKFIRGLWAYRNYGIFRIPYFFFVWPLMWVHYLFIALKEKPDLIYPHSRDDQIIFTLLKPLHRTPVAWRDPSDLHYFLQNNNQNPLARFYRWILIKAMSRANAIFTLTREEQGLIIEHSNNTVSADTVRLFQSNIIFSNYNLDEKPLEKKGRLVIGVIIRLVEDKGVQHLIKAFVRLAETHPQIELWIVGDGDYREELERLSIDHKRIRFWGQQQNQSEFYATFDIFVQPANYEGWGRTIKEAMYFGLPILGSHTGGIAIQIDDGQTGLFFTPKSPVELEKQLSKLITDKDLRLRLGKTAAQKARADGDFMHLFRETVVPAFEQIIKEAK